LSTERARTWGAKDRVRGTSWLSFWFHTFICLCFTASGAIQLPFIIKSTVQQPDVFQAGSRIRLSVRSFHDGRKFGTLPVGNNLSIAIRRLSIRARAEPTGKS